MYNILHCICVTCVHILSNSNEFVFFSCSLMSGVKNNVGRGINVALVNGKNNYCTLLM